MLVAACVCPHPPLLVPDVASGAAAETADLRRVCRESLRRLVASGATRVAVVGAAADGGAWDETAGGSMRRFGVDVSFGGAGDVLPLSLTVGAFLLDAVGWTGPRDYVGVSTAATPDEAAAIGASLGEGDDLVALLVMGDGSAKRAVASPGYLDDRAAGYDESAVAALSAPDPRGLLALDPALADDLWVAGRAPWQVLAGAAQAAYRHDGVSVTASVRYDAAPFGVGYFVVDWSVDRD